ncbi:MAG: conjugal transfer protein TraX [Defluviitaleaceae bacterium]|nr:conjugal transfer protein TraX [Defluviitaleaceae bacterium]
MTVFHLKVIALVTMVIDHTGAALFPYQEFFVLRVIGRVAFPIFVYLVAEGFRHTKSPGWFLARLGAFAIISEPFFDWTLRRADIPWGVDFFNNTNIFYTLFLGGLAITLYKIADEKMWLLTPLPVVAAAWLARWFSTDYAAYGVVFIFAMYWFKDFNKRVAAMVLLCLWQQRWVVQAALRYWLLDVPYARAVDTLELMLIPATLVGVVLVLLYNGKRGPGLKWFFYAAYPAHLAVLLLIRLNYF